jgi:hypothetical protein
LDLVELLAMLPNSPDSVIHPERTSASLSSFQQASTILGRGHEGAYIRQIRGSKSIILIASGYVTMSGKKAEEQCRVFQDD